MNIALTFLKKPQKPQTWPLSKLTWGRVSVMPLGTLLHGVVQSSHLPGRPLVAEEETEAQNGALTCSRWYSELVAMEIGTENTYPHLPILSFFFFYPKRHPSWRAPHEGWSLARCRKGTKVLRYLWKGTHMWLTAAFTPWASHAPSCVQNSSVLHVYSRLYK